MFKFFKQIAHLALITGLLAGPALHAQTPEQPTRRSSWLNFGTVSGLVSAAAFGGVGCASLAQGNQPAGAYWMGAGALMGGLTFRYYFLKNQKRAAQLAHVWPSVDEKMQNLYEKSPACQVKSARESLSGLRKTAGDDVADQLEAVKLFDQTFQEDGNFKKINDYDRAKHYPKTFSREIYSAKVDDIKEKSRQHLPEQKANASWYGKATTVATVGAIAGGTLAGASLVYTWLLKG